MSELPGDLQYTGDHEWLRREDDGNVTVGITDLGPVRLRGHRVFTVLDEVVEHIDGTTDHERHVENEGFPAAIVRWQLGVLFVSERSVSLSRTVRS